MVSNCERDSGIIDHDGSILTNDEVRGMIVRSEFLRSAKNELSGLSQYTEWQDIRQTWGERAASDFMMQTCFPEISKAEKDKIWAMAEATHRDYL